ncbi:adenylylsulfate kinase-like enzyme [Rhizobium sp. BK376]|nr:adenylylsulfate kinase-like enzyme [Rhizobium sp. BK376]
MQASVCLPMWCAREWGFFAVIISYRHSFTFLHCPKTAGSSINVALAPFLGPRDILLGAQREREKAAIKLNLRARWDAFRCRPDRIGSIVVANARRQRSVLSFQDRLYEPHFGQVTDHPFAEEVRRFDEAAWNRNLKFSFVRNPYARMASFYFYLTGRPGYPDMSFSQFVPRLIAGEGRLSKWQRLVSTWPIYTINDRVAVDFIGKFEQLPRDFAELCGLLDLPVQELPHAKAATQYDYRELYDEPTRVLVERACEKEIDHFGYRFQTLETTTRKTLPTLSTETSERKIMRKILIMGLPGSGKTTLAKALVPRLSAVHLNADEIRANINKDLSFSVPDRVEHARRMGWLADKIAASGSYVIADFVCPTPETREAFGDAAVIWVDRIREGRFADTNKLFVAPNHSDIRVTAEGSPEYWAEQICGMLRPVFDPKRPTALFVGRYQPFHDGHKALIEEGIRRVGQACIAVRDTGQLDEKNPYGFEHVRSRIEEGLRHYLGRFTVVQIPNITGIYYGRDVGYVVERIDLNDELHAISATKIRKSVLLNGDPKGVPVSPNA